MTIYLIDLVTIVTSQIIDYILCRSYKVSYDSYLRSVVHDDAYNFCNDRGLGLAVWKSAEAYEDIKYLANNVPWKEHSYVGYADFYTALNNENEEACNTDHHGKTDCDGKLIWRQNKCGPYELFEANPGHTK